MIYPPIRSHAVAPSEMDTSPFAGPCLNRWTGKDCEHQCLAPVAYPHVCRCTWCGHPNGAAQ